MIRQYEDKRIYKNLKIVKILSIISLVLSVIGVVAFIVRKYFGKSSGGFEYAEILFYLFTILLPVNYLLVTRASKISQDDSLKESKFNNDFSNTLAAALMPVVALVGMVCLSAGKGFYYFGFMCGAHLLFSPNIILIRNCVLIKREWKKQPPLWYSQEKGKKETIAEIEKNNKELKKEERIQEESERLLSLVGKRFFVNYYVQLKEWSELDILDIVQVQYGEKAAQKRIVAGKEIFQRGLEKTALWLICNSEENKIDATTREKAREILEEKFYKE